VQPLLDRQPVALRLGYLAALLVEEQLVGEPLGRVAAQQPADLLRQLKPTGSDPCPTSRNRRRAQPSASPVRLPLQLAVAAGHGNLAQGGPVLIREGDRPCIDVACHQWYLQHTAGRRGDGQNGL